jgi:transposase
MERETITLDARAQHRLYILNHVLTGEITAAVAAANLKLTVRTVRRLLAAYRSDRSAAALVHGNRGRVPPNRLDEVARARLLELATTTYAGANRAHLADLLAEREGIVIPERTLRRVLAEAGLPAARTRRPRGHRSRRERMSQAGLLLQVDGSRHDWLEGRGPWLTLVGGIDDASGHVTGGTFRDQEDAAGYFEMLRQTALGQGLPLGIYSDRHGIFWHGRHVATLAEQFSGRTARTQFGRALEAAGIAWIAARSPQAKGRVERLWGTLQDRLVTELRLAGAATREEANAVLAMYLPRHNARFAVSPANPEPAWRPLPADRSPESLFCFTHPRRVARDGTVTLAGRTLMLLGQPAVPGWRGVVVVEERLDGSLWARVDGILHPVVPAPERPVFLRERATARSSSVRTPPPPAPDHPWHRYPAVRPR